MTKLICSKNVRNAIDNKKKVKFRWKTTEPDVVKLSVKNNRCVKITGKKAGKAKVTARYIVKGKNKALHCSVTVKTKRKLNEPTQTPAMTTQTPAVATQKPVYLSRDPWRSVIHDLYTCENMIAWFNDPASQTMYDGRFKGIIDLYKNINYVGIPVVDNISPYNIFVDSKVNSIQFVYSKPSYVVYIEPLSSEEYKKYLGSDVITWFKGKSGIDLSNGAVTIDDSIINKPLYEGDRYEIHEYTVENVEFKEGVIQCIWDKSEYKDKSDGDLTSNLLTLIKDDLLISISYFDSPGSSLDIAGFKSLAFTKVKLLNK